MSETKQRTLDSFVTKKVVVTNELIKSTPKTSVLIGSKAIDILPSYFVRNIPENPRYQEQLKEEYELIDSNNFMQVFLQVRTIIGIIQDIGKESGKIIPYIIRGSAGSSLICYLLGITHIDPILHGIQLARFMNNGRTDMPDVDIDVPYNRREEIYGRIATTWSGQVARISNYCMWSEKTAIREATKEILRVKGENIPQAVNRKGFRPEKVLDGADLLEAKKKAKELTGTLKNYSKHCGGIVIFENEGAVPEELVLQEIKADGITLKQINLNKDDTEDRGFIKIDLLSNRGLGQLADICADRPFTAYPTRDQATERIFAKGLNIGITLGESRGMRKIFMEMKPEGVNDVAIVLALIRPAAAAEGRKQEFLDKWKKLGPKATIHGSNEDRLMRPIIYDDDAILKVQLALSCSSAEADRYRKAFAKGNARVRIEFRQAAKKAGHSQDTIDTLVDDLNQLVHYSFCKSHAVSYAQLVWALAYWKAHRPHEFWISALNHCQSEYRKWVHYREARCSGLLLTREDPPYRLGQRGGKPAIVPAGNNKSEQTRLVQQTPAEEFKDLGYWTGEEFIPTCGVFQDSQTRLDGVKTAKFKGIIACGRCISRDWGDATLICIGTANNEYYDLVIPEKSKGALFSFAALEGTGILVKGKHNTIEVTKIHGVAIKSLVNQ
jgi:error-prone DNA polymerase